MLQQRQVGPAPIKDASDLYLYYITFYNIENQIVLDNKTTV